MLAHRLSELNEAHLLDLGASQIPESISLEFKRQLDLSSPKEKAEAAKDVSALANTIGGQILYGVDEVTLADGSTVASSLCPLTDGTLKSRLEDVLLASIHPRPQLRLRDVPVAGGHVLVVEVYPGLAGDLYMVTGFKEYRFYLRSEQRTAPMTEPEVRERYARIAASRQALERSQQRSIAAEFKRARKREQSVLVIPWFGRRDLVNPRRFGRELLTELAKGPLRSSPWRDTLFKLRITSEGIPNALGWLPVVGRRAVADYH